MKQPRVNIQIMENAPASVFSQRETNITHTSYEAENAFYTLVQRGDVEGIAAAMEQFFGAGLVVGRLSKNTLRQAQYWAVCCITLATRYAIRGGLDEMQAYTYSDWCIMQVDGFTSPDAIFVFLGEHLLQVTALVQNAPAEGCPPAVRRCLAYINRHLHENIRLEDLAAEVNFSPDYVARLFKTHLGKTPRQFITGKKLAAACAMLRAGQGQKQVAYTLGFCSQTYFCTCFKKAYGQTPREYAQGHPGEAQMGV